MKHGSLIVGALLGAVLLASTPSVEARRGDHDRPDRAERSDRHDRVERYDRPARSWRRPESRRDGMSLDEAVSRVRRDTGGRVLSAQPYERNGEAGYRIKVLMPDGAVRIYHMDGGSAR